MSSGTAARQILPKNMYLLAQVFCSSLPSLPCTCVSPIILLWKSIGFFFYLLHASHSQHFCVWPFPGCSHKQPADAAGPLEQGRFLFLSVPRQLPLSSSLSLHVMGRDLVISGFILQTASLLNFSTVSLDAVRVWGANVLTLRTRRRSCCDSAALVSQLLALSSAFWDQQKGFLKRCCCS